MNVHEYQAKEILKSFNVAIPRGSVSSTVDEAVKVAEEIGGDRWVVKAQIHAGGRGKGGGVKMAGSLEEVRQNTSSMLGMRLITHQTGAEGRIVRRVLVEEGLDISRELYVGITLDRTNAKTLMMVSAEGGVEIETVAVERPESIRKEEFDPGAGFLPYQSRKLVFGLGLSGDAFRHAVRFLHGLSRAYKETDASLVEINPLVLTGASEVVALDAKMSFDDNALYRHPEIAAMRDLEEEEQLEVEASQHGLSYIKLDGNVGCMVNGAGLAMATMDIIKLAGGEPANFLDVGGAAKPETIANGFRILLSDQNVRAVLINIFGGIVRCDRVAYGIVEAARQIEIEVPVVIRLEGTNAKEAANILQNSGLRFEVAATLQDAAKKVTSAITV